MLFVAICVDKANHLELRKTTRDSHLAYISTLGDRLKVAGRMMSGPDGAPSGSVLIIEADDIETVSDILGKDPYAQAGLFKHTAIEPFAPARGVWLPDGEA
ncbi:MAG: YciI family protein [Pseudomonadota bacterium]